MTMRITIELDTNALRDGPGAVTRRAVDQLSRAIRSNSGILPALWPAVQDNDWTERPIRTRDGRTIGRFVIDRSDVGDYDAGTAERERKATALWDLSNRLINSPDLTGQGTILSRRLDVEAALLVHRTAP